jgi:hypothetical protein
MRFTPDVCPDCGEPIYGTCDMIPGAALLTANDDGTFDYSGETDVFWDGQTTNEAGEDRVWVQCHNGHEWKAAISDD